MTRLCKYVCRKDSSDTGFILTDSIQNFQNVQCLKQIRINPSTVFIIVVSIPYNLSWKKTVVGWVVKKLKLIQTIKPHLKK